MTGKKWKNNCTEQNLPIMCHSLVICFVYYDLALCVPEGNTSRTRNTTKVNRSWTTHNWIASSNSAQHYLNNHSKIESKQMKPKVFQGFTQTRLQIMIQTRHQKHIPISQDVHKNSKSLCFLQPSVQSLSALYTTHCSSISIGSAKYRFLLQIFMHYSLFNIFRLFILLTG